MILRILTRIVKKVVFVSDAFIRSVIVVFLGLMLFVICLQIFCRFALNNALPWPEEAAVYLMIWYSLLATIYVQIERGHLRLSFFVEKLPKNAQLVTNIILNMAIIAFLLVVLKGGIFEVRSLVHLETGALRISRAIPYLSLPVFAVLFIIVNVRLIVEDLMELARRWRY